MRKLILIIGLFLVIGLIAGCAGPKTAPESPTKDAPEDTVADSEVNEELEGTYVADEDLDVGEMI